MLLALNSGPWFADWNYRVLAYLFSLWPQNGRRVSIAEFLVAIPLVSTWVFAVAYYLLWRIEDGKAPARRRQLLAIPFACALAVMATLAVRPWAAWPCPSRVPMFQSLYPPYLWNLGVPNCFPSHSTLICLIVAIGILPASRRVGAFLIVFTLLAVSLPRIYIGGHYPIDVAASVVLSVFSIALVWGAAALPRMQERLTWLASRGMWTEFFLFLWTFELGEGFRSSLTLLHVCMHAVRHFTAGNF